MTPPPCAPALRPARPAVTALALTPDEIAANVAAVARAMARRRPPTPVVVIARPIEDAPPAAEPDANRPPMTFARIKREICEKYRISRADFDGPRRLPRFCDARQEAWRRAMAETTLSKKRIGHMSGGRNHTTVLSGVRAYEARHGLPPARAQYRRCAK